MSYEQSSSQEGTGLEMYSHPEPGDLIDLRTPIPKRPSRRRRSPQDHFPEARRRVFSDHTRKVCHTELANEEAWRKEDGVGDDDDTWKDGRRRREEAGGEAVEAGGDDVEEAEEEAMAAKEGGQGVWTTRGSRYAALVGARSSTFQEASGEGNCYVFSEPSKVKPAAVLGGLMGPEEEDVPYPFRRCSSARGDAVRPSFGFRERASLGAKERRRRRPWLGFGSWGRREVEEEGAMVQMGEEVVEGVGAVLPSAIGGGVFGDGMESEGGSGDCVHGEGMEEVGGDAEEEGAMALVKEEEEVEDEDSELERKTHTPVSGSDAEEEELDWSWVEELPVSAFEVPAAVVDPGVPSQEGTEVSWLGRPSPPHLGLRPEEKERLDEVGERVDVVERRRRPSSASPPPRRMRRCLAASPIATLPRGGGSASGEGQVGSSGHVTSARGRMLKVRPTGEEDGAGGMSSGEARESVPTAPDPPVDGGGVAAGEPPPPFRASMRRVRPFRLSSRRLVHSAPDAVQDPGDDSGEEEIDPARPSRLENTTEEAISASGRTDAPDSTTVEVGDEGGDGSREGSDSEEGQRSSSGGDGGTGDSNMESGAAQSPFDQWPHGFSSMLACLGCTVGLFSISRFAILSIHFGANFIIQFIILSVVFGIPLYSFHVSIGQYLGAGVIDMWKISPVFQGIGVALLASQALLGIYSIVGVSWMFVYFRDSFITKQDLYRWAEPFDLYREGSPVVHNGTFKLEETVPDYFSGVVLQRHNLSTSEGNFGHLKFQLVFNLAVVWMIIFVCLCKGLKSYGKVVYVFVPLAVVCIAILCIKMLGITPLGDLRYFFHETVWSEFFLNTKCWVSAATEAFFTWGLLGASAMQIASHNAGVGTQSGCKKRCTLHRDTIIVVSLTMIILLLSSVLGHACVHLLHSRGGFEYMPSSFEKLSTYAFLWPLDPPEPVSVESSALPPLPTTPTRYMTHVPLMSGTQVAIPWGPINFGWSQSGELEFLREATTSGRSGYQSLRLATEIAPSAFALLGSAELSPFWAVLFYFTLILFGIAQQLAIWHCVITGITAINVKKLKVWETTITFFACAFGFVLGLPMTTELGIFVVHFLDYCIGCGWWMMALYLTELGSVLVIRGRPYGGENVVTALFPSLRAQQNSGLDQRRRPQPTCLATWAAPTLAFAWNVMLPVALMVLAITVFKNGNFRSLYNWSVASNSASSFRGYDDYYIHFRGEDFEHAINYSYWPVWTRQVGSFLQLIPLLAVPLIALIQTVRYLSSGSPDLFERIQALYRPRRNSRNSSGDFSQGTSSYRGGNTDRGGQSSGNTGASNGTLAEMGLNFEDPPPKYTPPPSYTTATGARIAKLLRQSFRRSMRRLTTALNEAGGSQVDVGGNQSRTVESGDGPSWGVERNTCCQQNRLSLPPLPSSTISVPEENSSPQPPPDYASVLIEIRQALLQNLQQGTAISNIENQEVVPNEDLTELQRATAFVRGEQIEQNRISTATPERVATLLRSSGRRPNHARSNFSAEAPIPSNKALSSSIHSSTWRSSFRGASMPSGSNMPSVSGARPSESIECLVDRAVPIHEESSSNDDSVPNNGGEDNLGLDIQGMSSSAI